MKTLQLDNSQRKYFGLDPILDTWDRIILKGDSYRPDSLLYFDGDTLKKQVISSKSEYKELNFSEETKNKEFLLPKTKRGKPKKLSSATLESRNPIGVYLYASSQGDLVIGNHTTNTTFYSRNLEYKRGEIDLGHMINEFINDSKPDHFDKIKTFKNSKRKNVKYKSGDFFAFKLNRNEYGFGRILLDINKTRKKKLINDNHGLSLLMGPPVLIKFYAHKSHNKNIDTEILKTKKSLPSDYIMDNVIFYGEYEVIGNTPLEIDELDFPISYGGSLYQTQNVFLQWGLIHKELPKKEFSKYLSGVNEHLPDNSPSKYIRNPYGYYSLGFRSKFDTNDIIEAIKTNGNFDYDKNHHFGTKWDLRNPKNDNIRIELFKAFGLDPTKDYENNARTTDTKDIFELIAEIK